MHVILCKKGSINSQKSIGPFLNNLSKLALAWRSENFKVKFKLFDKQK